MEVSNQHELFVFFGSMAGGAAVGLLFDGFRILRRNFKTGRATLMLEDILFWVLLVAVIYTTVFWVNSAKLRWYEFAGMGLGCILYVLLLSKPILCFADAVIGIIKKLIFYLLRLLLFPIRLCYPPAKAVAKGCKRFFYAGKSRGKGWYQKKLHRKHIFRKI